MRVKSLYRYPVKGLSPEPLDCAELTRDGYFPGDRLFALENGPSGFRPEGAGASAQDQVFNADAQRRAFASFNLFR